MSLSANQIKNTFTTTTTNAYIPIPKYDNTIKLNYAGNTMNVNSD